MVDHNNFRDNLARANEGESEVGYLLQNMIPELDIKSFNNDNKFDIQCTFHGKEVTFEVKEDIRVNDTGNVVVEFESFGKVSGIYTSQATFWIFRLHVNNRIEHYMILTSKLKDLIAEKKYARIFQMRTTDSSNRVYFFRYAELIRHCLLIDKY